MNAHTAAPTGHRHRIPVPRIEVRAFWAWPLFLGLFLGMYAGFMHHQHGSSQPAAVGLGLITAFVTAVACFLLGRAQHRMANEARAAAYGALFGCAIGWLQGLGDETILKSCLMGLGLGLVMTLVSFYAFHVHSD